MTSPVRLQKVEDMSTMAKIEAFLMRYAYILLPIFIILLLLFVLALVIIVIDISSANSMVESGTYYNHFKDVI